MIITQRAQAVITKLRPVYKPKVFGIGYPKTGTTTFGECMKVLGYKHTSYDMNLALEVRSGNTKNAIKVARSHESFEDWPWFLIYEELSTAFPNAKFVLTKRASTDLYLGSLHRFRTKQGMLTGETPEPDWWRPIFDYPATTWDPDKFGLLYEKHNSRVIEVFEQLNQSHRLLEVCWEQGDGWRKLCDFLDLEVPDQDFPHLNRTSPADEKA